MIFIQEQNSGKLPNKDPKDLVNNLVRFPQVLVIGPNGEQLGVMSSREAQFKANDYQLDLLCVAPNANPPVCKILNYGKYRYEMARKEKEAKESKEAEEARLAKEEAEREAARAAAEKATRSSKSSSKSLAS